jgi:hypothetical protein
MIPLFVLVVLFTAVGVLGWITYEPRKCNWVGIYGGGKPDFPKEEATDGSTVWKAGNK